MIINPKLGSVIFYFSIISCCTGCSTSVSTNTENKGQSKLIAKADTRHQSVANVQENPNAFFTLLQAGRILGEPVQLKDSSASSGQQRQIFSSSYTAIKKDPKSKKTGTVYFMYEKYLHLDSAKNSYAFIKTGNQDHGITVLNDRGDEAYFHTDNENFYFVLVRKGNKMIRMKVNKITPHTSKDEFNKVVREITGLL